MNPQALIADAPASMVPAQSEAAAVLHMIERAARDPSVDMDKMLKLMDMRDKAEAKQSRKAFDEAVAAAKGQIPPDRSQREGPQRQKVCRFRGDCHCG